MDTGGSSPADVGAGHQVVFIYSPADSEREKIQCLKKELELQKVSVVEFVSTETLNEIEETIKDSAMVVYFLTSDTEGSQWCESLRTAAKFWEEESTILVAMVDSERLESPKGTGTWIMTSIKTGKVEGNLKDEYYNFLRAHLLVTEVGNFALQLLMHSRLKDSDDELQKRIEKEEISLGKREKVLKDLKELLEDDAFDGTQSKTNLNKSLVLIKKEEEEVVRSQKRLEEANRRLPNVKTLRERFMRRYLEADEDAKPNMKNKKNEINNKIRDNLRLDGESLKRLEEAKCLYKSGDQFDFPLDTSLLMNMLRTPALLDNKIYQLSKQEKESQSEPGESEQITGEEENAEGGPGSSDPQRGGKTPEGNQQSVDTTNEVKVTDKGSAEEKKQKDGEAAVAIYDIRNKICHIQDIGSNFNNDEYKRLKEKLEQAVKQLVDHHRLVDSKTADRIIKGILKAETPESIIRARKLNLEEAQTELRQKQLTYENLSTKVQDQQDIIRDLYRALANRPSQEIEIRLSAEPESGEEISLLGPSELFGGEEDEREKTSARISRTLTIRVAASGEDSGSSSDDLVGILAQRTSLQVTGDLENVSLQEGSQVIPRVLNIVSNMEEPLHEISRSDHPQETDDSDEP